MGRAGSWERGMHLNPLPSFLSLDAWRWGANAGSSCEVWACRYQSNSSCSAGSSKFGHARGDNVHDHCCCDCRCICRGREGELLKPHRG
jgi:hypothetical protein